MKTSDTETQGKLQIYFSLAVIVLTAFILFFLFNHKTSPSKPVISKVVPTVDVVITKMETLTIPLQARGIIEPEKQMSLVSQVIGTVTHITDKFEAGSNFKRGDILLQADTTYLNMELQKAKAAYEQAALHELEIKAQIEAVGLLEGNENNSALAQGKPQLAVATSAREAALALMQLAQKQMDNATLRAPFNGRVMARNIQELEQLFVGRPLAQIYSTEAYRIRFPLTQEQFALAGIPSIDNKTKSPLLISNENTGQQWRGEILRSEGFIAPNHMIYVIAKVFAEKSSLEEIVSGTLLKIDMQGKPLHNAISLPLSALHSDNTVWVISADNRLHSKKVELFHRGADHVYIASGLQIGEKVVIAPIAGATENMLIKQTDLSSTISSIKDKTE